MLRQIVLKMGAGFLATLVLAVIAGGLARALMRLLAVLAGEEGRFSIAGTLGILLAFAVMMVPGGVAAALGARRTSRVLLALGAAALLFQSAVILVQEDRTAFVEATGLVQALTVVVLLGFPAVIVAQAVVTGRVAASLGRRVTAHVRDIPEAAAATVG